MSPRGAAGGSRGRGMRGSRVLAGASGVEVVPATARPGSLLGWLQSGTASARKERVVGKRGLTASFFGPFLGMEKINFSGGEPFLQDRGEFVGKLVQFCKQELKLPSVSIVSNGSLIRERWFKKYGKEKPLGTEALLGFGSLLGAAAPNDGLWCEWETVC